MNLVSNDLEKLDIALNNEIKKYSNSITKDICDFINAKSKRLRPVLIFLITKALNNDIDEKIINLAAAVELIHNATLIHDDIIDNAKIRRARVSLNASIGNNLSVLAGDLLLVMANRILNKFNNIDIFDVFSKSLSLMCLAEINQYFLLNKVPDFNTYIEKSKNKTAQLFIASIDSLCKILDIKECEALCSFALNFGIAFQIKDDLINILNNDTTKQAFSDVYNGIYTAPIIFLNNITGDVESLSKEEIISKLARYPEIIQKTYDLIRQYSLNAIASLKFISDNQYKIKLVELCENLYKAV